MEEALRIAVPVIRDLGFLGMAVGFIWALYKEIIVWGKDHRESVDQREKQIAEYKILVDKTNSETAEKLRYYEQRERDRRSS